MRITSISTPVGGVNWEYTDDSSSAIMYIAVLLESKRLLTMPFSRPYCHLPLELDIEYCVQSASKLKDTIPLVLNSHKVSPPVLVAINEIIHALQDFLNDAVLVRNAPVIMGQSMRQQKFQSMVKQLKEKVAKTMKPLLEDISRYQPLSDKWRILSNDAE